MTKPPKRERRKRRSRADRPILDGHIRDKKKLIPPMLGFPQTAFVSTIDSIFPEIVWIGVLFDSYGLRDGVEIASRTLKNLWNAQKDVNWYRFSEVAAHESDVTRILNDDERAEIEVAFAAFRSTYNWPGLDWANSDEDASQAKMRMDSAIRKYADRFEQP